MKVGLFIPCYVDQLFPKAGMATLELLEKLGVDVEYPVEQTCCGQPMANTGCTKDAAPAAKHFVNVFKKYDKIVSPSGSCVSMVRNHYKGLVDDSADSKKVCENTYELCEFMADVLNVEKLDAKFNYKVGLHQSCHGLRELRLGESSERVKEPFSKVRKVLELVDGVQVIDLQRPDECCGFGGTFSVAEEAVSCRMGRDRIADHVHGGAEVLTATDLSCLMHLNGLIKRDGTQLKVIHIAEILNGVEV